jgi:hypothetical protein
VARPLDSIAEEYNGTHPHARDGGLASVGAYDADVPSGAAPRQDLRLRNPELRALVEVVVNCVITAGAQGVAKWASGTVEYQWCGASA